MPGDGNKADIMGNRPSGDGREIRLGKPTGPKPQRLLEKLPLSYISRLFYDKGTTKNEIFAKALHEMEYFYIYYYIWFGMCIFCCFDGNA